ncbi:hypothetical protein M911_02375 [Ectothiorhodospira haloalkaliphila]|uniref:Uncharacterized protein n=1 Tax=Ectothiorhodospira haloalkaliphila TaxID=421628 RepID=W8KEM9_9GAMM|nr:hypothetical protein [Ectothiorhodospira haloalkaliphila]AHK78204.1 hypothetical protein M911_02375 [Ectothiorhodospira haloalkaliphila]
MSREEFLPVDRFLHTLEIVSREGHHLAYSWRRLYTENISEEWVRQLEDRPEMAERLEAFVSRFSRMQDTIADKLLPRWLRALAETPGSQIEVLNRAERLGVLSSTSEWLEARKLRNELVHEYMTCPAEFAASLLLARDHALMLMDTYDSLREDAQTRLNLPDTRLPGQIKRPC